MINVGGGGWKMIRKCHDPDNELCDWMQRPSLYAEPPPIFDHEGVLDAEIKEIAFRIEEDPDATIVRSPIYNPVKLKPTPLLDGKRQK